MNKQDRYKRDKDLAKGLIIKTEGRIGFPNGRKTLKASRGIDISKNAWYEARKEAGFAPLPKGPPGTRRFTPRTYAAEVKRDHTKMEAPIPEPLPHGVSPILGEEEFFKDNTGKWYRRKVIWSEWEATPDPTTK